jgi:hypothetical protein
MTRKPRPKARTPLSGVSRTRWVHQEAQGGTPHRKHARVDRGGLARGGDSPVREHAGARNTLWATPQARKGGLRREGPGGDLSR